MFNSVCKTLLLHYGRRYTISSSNFKDFAFSVFIRCISTTTTTSNQHPFTVTYLINSCGFSLKSALSASKLVHFESPEKPDSVIEIFKSHGFSEAQISKVIRAHPQVLCASVEDTLLPKMQFFYSRGFSTQDLAKLICTCPNLLLRSLEKHLIPTFNYLSNLFPSSGMTVAAIKCSPFVLQYGIKTCIAPSVDVLRDMGAPDQIILEFLRTRPRCFSKKMDTFKDSAEAVKVMGFDPSSSKFIQALTAIDYGRSYWESKVNTYKKWGWSEGAILDAFRKNPACMMASKDKIMAVMNFLVNKMGLESSAIANRPDLISLSVEKRFIPRAAVFQFLLSKGLINRTNTNLITFFSSNEKTFLRKFVDSYDEAPELLKLYQKKLGLLKRT